MSREISLSKFLSRFYNLSGEQLTTLTHNDVEVLFPNVEKPSDEELEINPLLLTSDCVIFVNDGNRSIPYYVPITNEFGIEDSMEVEGILQEEISVDYSKHDYTHMSIYELRQLLRKKFNSFANQKAARRELERRGVKLSKKYNRCKEKRKVRKIEDERY